MTLTRTGNTGAAGRRPRRVGTRASARSRGRHAAPGRIQSLGTRAHDWVIATEDASVSQVVAAAPKLPVREVFHRFWPYARRRLRWIIAALLVAALAPAVAAVEIWLFKVVVDDVLVPRNFGLFPKLALAYLGLTLLSGVLDFSDDVLSGWLSQRFLLDLRTDTFRHLHRLSLDVHERLRVGDLLSRLSGDISAIEAFLVSGVTSFVANAVQLLVFTGMLFYLQWEMALLSLLVAPLFWRLAQRFARLIKQNSRERRRRSGSMNALAEESLSNVELVQAYNAEDRETDRFRRAGESKYAAEMAATRLQALYSPFVDLLELAGALAVLGLGAYELSRGRLTLGELLIFITYLSQLFGPVRGLSRLVTTAYSASAGAERVIELLDEQPRVTSAPGAHPLTHVAGCLELDDVTFAYPGRHVAALRHLSVRVRPGEALALVGPSGAGKSTVTKLLLRFFDPQEGRVLLDGADLRELDLQSLRDNVALVQQETLLLDASVRENIEFGKPGATEAEVIAAARAADAHDFIMALEHGYETRLGERAKRLSGGQRQRIAIARAMVRDAPILVLDEPTTGLDAASAQRIMEPLRRLMAGRTTVVVSHNLLLAQHASQVLVLENGTAVESGAPDALLRVDGRYANLRRLAGYDGELLDASIGLGEQRP